MTLEELQVVITTNIAPTLKQIQQFKAAIEGTARTVTDSAKQVQNQAAAAADKAVKSMQSETSAAKESGSAAEKSVKQKGQSLEEIAAIAEEAAARYRNSMQSMGDGGPLGGPVKLTGAPPTATQRMNVSEPQQESAQPEEMNALEKLRAGAMKVRQAFVNMFGASKGASAEAQAAADELAAKLDNINARADIQRKKLAELQAEYEHISDGAGGAGSEQAEILQAKIVATEARLQSLSVQSDKAAAALRELDSGMSSAAPASDKAAKGADRAGTAFKSAGNRASGFSRDLDRMRRQILSQILVYGLLMKGLSALGTYMWSALKTNTAFSNSLNNLKVQLLTAFNPIYQAALPALTSLINALAKAMAYVAAFMSGLFGTTYAQSQKSASALNNNVKALEATGKAAEKAKKSLAGFDELNVLEAPTTASTSDTGADKSIVSTDFGGASSKPLISEAQIKSAEAAGERVRAVFEKIYSFAKKYEGPIKAVIAGIVAAFLTFKAVSFVSGIVSGIGKAIGVIASPAGAAVIGIAALVGEIVYLYNTNKSFHDDVVSKWSDIKKTFSTGFNFSNIKNALVGLQSAVAPFTKTIWDGISWGISNVLAPLSKWVVNQVLPGFLNILSGAFKILNNVLVALKPLGQWLWSNFLDPIAKWTGGVIVTVLNGVAKSLTTIGNWIKDHQEAVQNIAIVVGSFAAAWGLVNAAIAIWNTIGVIATAVQTALNVAMTANPIGIIIVAIGLLIAAVVLCIKYWGNIKDAFISAWNAIRSAWDACVGFFKSIWDGIVGVFRSVKDWFVSVFGGAYQGIVGAWRGIVGFFQGLWDGIVAGFKAFINFIIGGINLVIRGIDKLNFNVPNWVPMIGGDHVGLNIPEIPRLASGGITGVNNPFLAMVGDNPTQREVVSPLGDLMAMIQKAVSGSHTTNGNINLTIPIYLDKSGSLVGTIVKKINLQNANSGASAIV